MTIEQPRAIRPTMVRSGNSCSSDHVLPSTEVGVLDPFAYACSPNSLHLYDQERVDSSGTFSHIPYRCSSTPVTTNEEFDLKPQFESNTDFFSMVSTDISTAQGSVPTEINMWTEDKEPEKLDLDDIFLMEKTDAITGPTLAQLNFREPLMDDFVNDSFSGDCRVKNVNNNYSSPTHSQTTVAAAGSLSHHCWEDVDQPVACYTMTKNNSYIHLGKLQTAKTPSPPQMVSLTASDKPSTLSVTDAFKSGFSPTAVGYADVKTEYKSSLHKLLSEQNNSTPLTYSSLPCSSTPTEEVVEKKWEEIKQFIHQADTPEIKRERNSSASSCSVFTNEDQDSNEDMSEDSGSGGDDDWMSDGGDSIHSHNSLGEDNQHSIMVKKKEKQYFWQYNVQSKGPKGKKMRLLPNEEDPHILNNFEDPVFDMGNSSVLGLRHSGKARKGDGNDIYPNPSKLYTIGQQLQKLNNNINEFMPASELPASVRNRTRKEKNKLASRACRLKKKAQHEANKVKLYGLEQEHRQLMIVIDQIKQEMIRRLEGKDEAESEKLTVKLEKSMKQNLTKMIGGYTADYVNTVIEKVKAGDPSGGLNMKKIRKARASRLHFDDESNDD